MQRSLKKPVSVDERRRNAWASFALDLAREWRMEDELRMLVKLVGRMDLRLRHEGFLRVHPGRKLGLADLILQGLAIKCCRAAMVLGDGPDEVSAQTPVRRGRGALPLRPLLFFIPVGGRVGQGDYSPRPPTDPDVRD